jgi:hypothetical protein
LVREIFHKAGQKASSNPAPARKDSKSLGFPGFAFCIFSAFFAQPVHGIADAIHRVMMHKQHAMTLSRPWAHADALRVRVREFIANLKYLVEIPTGYQDETGFHLGTEPEKSENQWPRS